MQDSGNSQPRPYDLKDRAGQSPIEGFEFKTSFIANLDGCTRDCLVGRGIKVHFK